MISLNTGEKDEAGDMEVQIPFVLDHEFVEENDLSSQIIVSVFCFVLFVCLFFLLSLFIPIEITCLTSLLICESFD